MEQYLEPPEVRTVSTARVVRIVPEYAGGAKASYGLQPVYYNLSKVQAVNGHEVHVITRRRSAQPGLEARPRVL